MDGDGSLIPGNRGKSGLMHCLSYDVVTESINDTSMITESINDTDYSGTLCAVIDAMVILQTINICSSGINNCKDLVDALTTRFVQKRGTTWKFD